MEKTNKFSKKEDMFVDPNKYNYGFLQPERSGDLHKCQVTTLHSTLSTSQVPTNDDKYIHGQTNKTKFCVEI